MFGKQLSGLLFARLLLADDKWGWWEAGIWVCWIIWGVDRKQISHCRVRVSRDCGFCTRPREKLSPRELSGVKTEVLTNFWVFFGPGGDRHGLERSEMLQTELRGRLINVRTLMSVGEVWNTVFQNKHEKNVQKIDQEVILIERHLRLCCHD